MFCVVFVVVVGLVTYSQIPAMKVCEEDPIHCTAITGVADKAWCEQQGGHYFQGGFGGSRCQFPPNKN